MDRLIFILIVVILSQSCKKTTQQLEVEKIMIKEESCGFDCIGISSVRIYYFFKSNHMIDDTLIYSKEFPNTKLKRYSYKKNNQGEYLYQYVYNDIDLSKYLSLNSVKKNYKEMIYFKRLNFDSNYILKSNRSTKIEYFLNGRLVNERDEDKMNFPKLVPPPDGADIHIQR